MSAWAWLGVGLAVAILAWAVLVVVLVATGRRADARALARVVPDCLVLVRRLLADPRVPRRHKLLLGAVAAYLALPFDLVPDFVPIAGQLDDVLVVALALRAVLRAAGPEVIAELWPGPPESRDVLLRLAGATRTHRAPRRPAGAPAARRRRPWRGSSRSGPPA